MLNKVIFLICTALMFESCRLQAEITPIQLSIRLLVNYEEARQIAKNSSKPMLLFSTGSDWCGWWTKLEDEALDTHEFGEAAGNKFIFVKVDFPHYNDQESPIQDRNQKLQKQFDVRSFPTVELAESNDEQQIGIVGYRPGGGKSLADHLNRRVHNYVSYKRKMSRLNHSKSSGNELKQLNVCRRLL